MGVKWTVHREVGKQPLYYYRGPVRERREREREIHFLETGENNTSHYVVLEISITVINTESTTLVGLRLDPGSVIPGCGWGWSGGEDQSPCSRDNASVSPPTLCMEYGRVESWMKWDSFTTRYSRLYPKEPLPLVTSGWDSALFPMHQDISILDGRGDAHYQGFFLHICTWLSEIYDLEIRTPLCILRIREYVCKQVSKVCMAIRLSLSRMACFISYCYYAGSVLHTTYLSKMIMAPHLARPQ